MGIEIEEPKQENWNSSLNVRGLVKNDYYVISIDSVKIDGEGNLATYGKFKSCLAFVDAWEYKFYDADQGEVVKKVLSEPIRCNHFINESLYKKIIDSGIPQGQRIRIKMTEKNGGKNWEVSQFDVTATPTTPAAETVSPDRAVDATKSTTTKHTVNGELVKEITPDMGENVKQLKTQVQSLINSNFDKTTITGFLEGQYKKESIEKVYDELKNEG